MRSGTLDASSRNWHVQFASGSVDSASEAFIVGFAALDHWDSEELFVNVSVLVEDLVHEDGRLIVGGVSSVTLLPQELSRANEWGWVLEFPTHNIRPLIQ